MNDSGRKDAPQKNNDQRPVARTVIGAIAIGTLAATVGMTTACCQGVNISEGEGEGESN